MSKVNFKKLVVEGFGAIQSPLLIDLDRKGVWLVKGDNGAGKTTIFSALCWVLYQVNLKGTVNDKVATWEHKRTEAFKGTRVILTLEKGETKYMIARHLGFKGKTMELSGASRLMIFKKDISDDTAWTEENLVGSELNKDGMQTYINELLGIDSKTFVNSILFGQRMKRLVESDNEEKRELLEKLFELSFVAEAKDRAKTKLAKVNELIQLLKLEEDTTTTNLASSERRLVEYKTVLDNFAEQKKTRIEEEEKRISWNKEQTVEYEGKLKTAKDEFSKIPDDSNLDRKDYDKVKENYNTTLSRVNELKKEISEHNSEIANANKNKAKLQKELADVSETCYACGQALNEADLEKVKSNLKNEIKKEDDAISVIEFALPKIKTNLEKIESELVVKEKAVEEIRTKYQNIDLNIEKRRNKSNEIAGIEKDLKRFAEAKTDIENRISSIEKEEKPKLDVEALETEIEKNKERLTEIAEDKSGKAYLGEKLKWWFSTGFGSNGLKSFVFNAMLSNLNHFVKKYVSRFGVAVEFSVDVSKTSKPFTTTCFIDGIEVDYKELSGGEKQRVDIALAFAMHDLVTMGTSSFNILILDELFENLDAKGIEIAFDLIRLKAEEDTGVWIVTHNAVIDSLNTKTIYLSKNKKGTFIDM